MLFWAIFEQNYDRLKAHIKHEKFNDFTENFKLCEVRESVNQPESKVQKGKMYISITISKKYSETKAKSTHTRTHRLASTVTQVHRHIVEAVAVKDSCFALIGAYQHSIAVESMNGNLWFRPFRATHESFKLFSSIDVNTFCEERRIIDVYL